MDGNNSTSIALYSIYIDSYHSIEADGDGLCPIRKECVLDVSIIYHGQGVSVVTLIVFDESYTGIL